MMPNANQQIITETILQLEALKVLIQQNPVFEHWHMVSGPVDLSLLQFFPDDPLFATGLKPVQAKEIAKLIGGEWGRVSSGAWVGERGRWRTNLHWVEQPGPEGISQRIDLSI